jgi:hypothetical protein
MTTPCPFIPLIYILDIDYHPNKLNQDHLVEHDEMFCNVTPPADKIKPGNIRSAPFINLLKTCLCV